MDLKHAKDHVWLTLWSLEFHRLKKEEGRVVAAMGWLGKPVDEIAEALAKYDESVAVQASSYADKGLLALCAISPTVSDNSEEANILAVRKGLPGEEDKLDT